MTLTPPTRTPPTPTLRRRERVADAAATGAIGAIARWSARHRLLSIGVWFALVVCCVVGGQAAGMRKATDAQLTAGEAGRAAALVAAAGLDGNDVESVLITNPGGRLDDTATRDAIGALAPALTGVSSVAAVAPAVRSADGSAELVQVTMTRGADDVQPLLQAVSLLQARHPEVRLQVTGSLAIADDVNAQVGRDFGVALVLSLPITILILLIVFGALLAAGVPVLLGATAVLAAVGLYSVASHVVPDGGTAAEMILLIGMAVGVDYSLFYLKREREERRAGRRPDAALAIATATAGHAVVTSGGAVAVSMAGLFLLGDTNFTSMAVGAIVVVLLAVVGSVTVLPAVLSALGERLDRPRIPLLSRLTMSGRPARVWPALLRPALHHPVATLAAGVLGLALLAWPATTLHLKNSTAADLPQSLPSVAAYQQLTTEFPGRRSSLQVVEQGAAADRSAVQRRVTAALAGQPSVYAGVQVTSADDTTAIAVDVPFDADSGQAVAALSQLRQSILPQARSGFPGVQVAVGGSIAENADYLGELHSGAPSVVAFVLLLTLLLMTWVFRSVVVGVVTIAANLLSAAAAFGVLVLVFQRGWGAALLGVHPVSGVIAWIPVFLFVILFGLSMDYHVLLVSRIREAVDAGRSTREAVREGVTASAPVITSAAAVMVGVFAIFAGLHLVEFKELGVGLAAAVLVDAVVVRILVLPALMVLLGPANWWAPKFLRRRTVSPAPDGPAPDGPAPVGPAPVGPAQVGRAPVGRAQ